LKAYARFGWAEPHVNAIEHYLGAGIVYQNEMQGLERSLGFAVGIAELGDPYRQAQHAAGVEARKREYCYELTSRWGLTERLVVQPDLQYIHHPGMDATLQAGWIAGLRVEISAFSSH
jgi:porin